LKIRCIHGYFIFEETKVGQISAFMSLYKGLVIVPVGDYYTFEQLKDAPDYSLEGSTFLGAETTKTFEGKPWEVMRENGLVYNFNTGKVVKIETVTQPAKILKGNGYYLADGLLLPGAVTDDGLRVTDYAAWRLPDSARFKYTGVTVE